MKHLKLFEISYKSYFSVDLTHQPPPYRHVSFTDEEIQKIENILSGVDGIRVQIVGNQVVPKSYLKVYRQGSLYSQEIWLHINKFDDEWYYVDNNAQRIKCDQFDGLLSYLQFQCNNRIIKSNNHIITESIDPGFCEINPVEFNDALGTSDENQHFIGDNWCDFTQDEVSEITKLLRYYRFYYADITWIKHDVPKMSSIIFTKYGETINILKRNDEWYYINHLTNVPQIGPHSKYYKCDQYDGLIDFISHFALEDPITRVLKNVKLFENFEEPTLKQKLESIISMYKYLWENDMGESLNNYTGQCSILFLTNSKVNNNWKRGGTIPPYTFDIDGLLNTLLTGISSTGRHTTIDNKLKLLEELYKYSQIKRFDKSKKDIELLINPILEITMSGHKIIQNYKIEQFYNGWNKKACFRIGISLDDELLELSNMQIKDILQNNIPLWNKKEKLKDVSDEFYHIIRIFKIEMDKLKNVLQENNLEYSISNMAHIHLYYNLDIYLSQIR